MHASAPLKATCQACALRLMREGPLSRSLQRSGWKVAAALESPSLQKPSRLQPSLLLP